MDWYEELPEQCPPGDAFSPDGLSYYRIAKGNPVEDSDFFSQRALSPDKVFKGKGINECLTRAISLFTDLEDVVRP